MSKTLDDFQAERLRRTNASSTKATTASSSVSSGWTAKRTKTARCRPAPRNCSGWWPRSCCAATTASPITSSSASSAGVTVAEFEETFAVALIVGGSIVIPHLRRAYARMDEVMAATV